ncbi:MAG: hypothetical protein JHC98_01700 [Thermoleophilaceae bacterium]|nr:hypothetical protein [Thermoleophilaceae bacterium]
MRQNPADSVPNMATRQLRPHLNQIRVWVRQGRTDAWIAHQLDATADEIAAFKREQSLDVDGAAAAENPATTPGVEEELDLRAEDDALIASELEAALAKREAEAAKDDEDEEGAAPGRRRRRGRRGGRGRRRPAFEATFDHGEEGYGLWLDPAIVDDPVYAEHWAGHRPITVTISSDQIVINRFTESEEPAAEEEETSNAA